MWPLAECHNFPKFPTPALLKSLITRIQSERFPPTTLWLPFAEPRDHHHQWRREGDTKRECAACSIASDFIARIINCLSSRLANDSPNRLKALQRRSIAPRRRAFVAPMSYRRDNTAPISWKMARAINPLPDRRGNVGKQMLHLQLKRSTCGLIVRISICHRCGRPELN